VPLPPLLAATLLEAGQQASWACKVLLRLWQLRPLLVLQLLQAATRQQVLVLPMPRQICVCLT
jgi:hypothetical protein